MSRYKRMEAYSPESRLCAVNEFLVTCPPKEPQGRLARLRKSAALRGKNGYGYRCVREAAAELRKENTPAVRYLLKTSLLRYVIGYAATERICPFSPRFEYRGKLLYHLADVRNLDSIRENGLLPNNGWVYLTDNVDLMLAAYAVSKARQLGRDVCFCVIPVDAELLAKRHRIFYARLVHEYVTECVEPEYLL